MKKRILRLLPALLCLLIMTCGCGGEEPLNKSEYHPIELQKETESVDEKASASEETKEETSDGFSLSIDENNVPSESDSSVDEDTLVPDCNLMVDYASELMYFNPGNYYELILDNSAYATQIGFEPVEMVTDFRVYTLSLHESPEGDVTFDAQEVYYLPELSSDKPLVVSVLFGDVLPVIGISFEDSDGQRVIKGVAISGYDTTILLQDIAVTNWIASVE